MATETIYSPPQIFLFLIVKLNALLNKKKSIIKSNAFLNEVKRIIHENNPPPYDPTSNHLRIIPHRTSYRITFGIILSVNMNSFTPW